ncbi:rRNA maturation RNase YbeY [Methylocapsa sp. S129]|uniref:rRNA maturation RNase YbeY n=1 Tax=Methylocapsa sp. S129 TaxID=1641869 RepID=UPI00131DF4B9|nr:rRNA maturation RNase YbeY [Methylocapsa sp. S129]
MKPNIEVVESSPQWRALPGIEKLARRGIEASLEMSGIRILDGAEVSVQLVDDSQIRALNAQWRGLDKPTNVLSFPASAPEKIAAAPMLGDIVMAFETAEREAAEEGKTLADHAAHLVVHGFLHLLGFDHQIAADANRMEALETRILAKLRIADPYALTVPLGANA